MLTLLYFASIRDAMGRSDDKIAFVPEMADVDGLLARLAQGDERAEILTHPSVRLIINDEIVPRDTVIKDGDTIAFCPPFSGG